MLLWAGALTVSSAQDVAALWAALNSGGHIALMRHAQAPGSGDPPGFKLDDCSTQRNLSQAGREQAQRIGRQFREQGVSVSKVFSSRWCRCLETARELNIGPVEPLAPLDSFFDNPAQGPERTAELRRLVSAKRSGPALVLVTHQVNITALTGIYPASGALVVIRPEGNGQFKVLGMIPE